MTASWYQRAHAVRRSRSGVSAYGEHVRGHGRRGRARRSCARRATRSARRRAGRAPRTRCPRSRPSACEVERRPPRLRVHRIEVHDEQQRRRRRRWRASRACSSRGASLSTPWKRSVSSRCSAGCVRRMRVHEPDEVARGCRVVRGPSARTSYFSESRYSSLLRLRARCAPAARTPDRRCRSSRSARRRAGSG